MKINLHHGTLGIARYEFSNKLLEQLVAEFCEEYNIQPSDTTIYELKDYNKQLPILVNWAVSTGWKINTWELKRHPDNGNLFAYGLDFADDCPYFMEARLKYS